ATQIGYALGLFFIIPLGDKVSNKKILKFDFLVMVISLIAAALSQSLTLLIISSFCIGFSSALPQLFVPMAAQLASDENRGRAIGIVMSGLLVGILGSRVISGLVGEEFGWRSMYYAASVLMFLLFILLQYKLPRLEPDYEGSYGSLLKSIGYYFKTEPSVRLAALRGGLGFAGVSAFWTTLVFLMEDSFGYGSDVAGGFGLFGVIGAVAAAVVGKLNDKVGKNKIIVYAIVLMVVSWVIFYFSAVSIIGLIAGIIIVDLGFQALHITNQHIIFSKNPDARNRVNTIYMVGFFMGGGLGTAFGAYAYDHFGWHGVAGLGAVLTLAIAVVQLFSWKNLNKEYSK
ncbi:MAG: MFS transporter, partial [Leeuwenhoekiella sp.]